MSGKTIVILVVFSLVGTVLILEKLDSWAANWTYNHPKGTGRTDRFARFVLGPDSVIYLYPGGRFGAPIACGLTIAATLFATSVIALCFLQYALVG